MKCLKSVLISVVVVFIGIYFETVHLQDVATIQRNNETHNIKKNTVDETKSRRYPDRRYIGTVSANSSFRYDPYAPLANNPRAIKREEEEFILRKGQSSSSFQDGKIENRRNPFDDPNRYRIPQQEDENINFVNGKPYRERFNIQDRFGNRFDPRFHRIPGEYDTKNDPRFSDPRFEDPRNVPKFKNNRHRIPQDRYDTKYRYYERFPERQRDKILDPNYDPRWDSKEPPAPGVLGGWLPELQGECRPGCENLRRDVTVNTNYGRVNGFLVYLYDGPRVPQYERPGVANVDKIKATVSVFMGIPYAQAPIGEARLMPPRPHRGWQNYNAVDWAPVCPQPVRFVGATKNSPLVDEDCLYLNIYTPSVESGQTQLFPVMFYIHGGEFYHGSGNEFPGHQLAAWGRVMVVTINYRLGALGFLSTGDQHAPGNYGLLDMAMALKWTYDNAYAFQGDRERITVFGPGAGGAAAGILAVMPKSRHFVRRVISISGSPMADWAVINDKFRAMNTSLVFGERVGCTIDSSWKLVDCIRRGRTARELTNIEFKPEIGTWPWAPVVQLNISVPEENWKEEWTSSDFMALPDLVSVLYENQMYNPKLEYLTGVARDDAAYMIYENKTLAPDYIIDWNFFDVMLRDHIKQYNYTLNPDGIFNAIKYMYTYYPDPNNKTHIREEFINFWSDFFFRAPQDAMVKTLVRNRVDTFMYVQNTTVEALKLPYWRQITHNLEYYFLSGAAYMDKVFFPENEQVSRYLWTESDRNMSEFFIFAFSNFSWYGHPTPKNILGVHWNMAIKGEILQYLAINTTENSTTQWNYRQKECAFWTEYLPSVIGYITPTYPPTTEFWWEPESPIQIAFWSISSVCLFLLVLVVVCCLLWRNAKRLSTNDDAAYYAGTESLKDDFNDYQETARNLMPMEGYSIGEPAGMGTAHTVPDILGTMPRPNNIAVSMPIMSQPQAQMGQFHITPTQHPQFVSQHIPMVNRAMQPTPVPSVHSMAPNSMYNGYPSGETIPMMSPQDRLIDPRNTHHWDGMSTLESSSSKIQPMGLPRSSFNLVPGRMSGPTQHAGFSRSASQASIRSSSRKDLSSTAV